MSAVIRCWCDRCTGGVNFTDPHEFIDAHPNTKCFVVVGAPEPDPRQLTLFDWAEEPEL